MWEKLWVTFLKCLPFISTVGICASLTLYQNSISIPKEIKTFWLSEKGAIVLLIFNIVMLFINVYRFGN